MDYRVENANVELLTFSKQLILKIIICAVDCLCPTKTSKLSMNSKRHNIYGSAGSVISGIHNVLEVQS